MFVFILITEQLNNQGVVVFFFFFFFKCGVNFVTG